MIGRSTHWILGLLVGLPLGGAAQDPADPPMLPPLHEDQTPTVVEETVRYTEIESGAAMTVQTVLQEGGAFRVERRESGGENEARSTFAIFKNAEPFILCAAGGTAITPEGTSDQQLEWPEAEKPPVRHWSKTHLGKSVRGTDRIPAPPVTELQLATVFRRVAWAYGFRFTIPLLWDLEHAGEAPAEPLRRATVYCSGRETMLLGEDRVPCWRIVVDSLGRQGPQRAVYWVGVHAPYRLERWEENDGRIYQRDTVPRASGSRVSGPPTERGSTEEPAGESPAPGESADGGDDR